MNLNQHMVRSLLETLSQYIGQDVYIKRSNHQEFNGFMIYWSNGSIEIDYNEIGPAREYDINRLFREKYREKYPELLL